MESTGSQKHNRRPFGNSCGQALVELGISLSLSVLILSALFDLSRVFYTALCLQQSLTEAARYGSIGSTLSGSTRVDSIMTKVRQISQQFGINPDTISVKSKGVEGTAGYPGEYFSISVKDKITMGPLTAPFLGLHVEVSGSVEARNEFFVS